MKKSILGLITVFLLIIIFAGCSAQSLGTAVPGNVKICLTTVDEMLIPEYSHSIDNAALINEFKVLEWEVDSSYTPSETKTLNFRGKTYETKFLLSSKLCMRSYSYDVYTYGSPNDADWMEFHVAHGNDDKIVGFRYNGAWVETPSSVPKSEKELIDIATEALSEFMDADYYTNVNVELMEMFNIWWVEFYNTIGDVEVADSSIVQLDMDGNVIAVEALPEPFILKAARYSELDGAQFDAKLEESIRKAYPDYCSDTDEKFAKLAYDGMKIEECKLSIDNEGRPILLYHIIPQLKYEVLYRGDLAEMAAEKGMEQHQVGVSESPIYAVVYLEEVTQ